MKIQLFFIALLACFTISCGDDDKSASTCDANTVINNSRYNSAMSVELTIISAEIVDDCLNVSYSGSGCDGESWELDLIDSGDIAESDPEQRYLRFNFTDNEDCEAVITQSQSFDISSLKTSNSEITLNIEAEGYSEQLLYSY